MKDEAMKLSSMFKHGIQLAVTCALVGTMWGVISTKVDALEKDEQETSKKIEKLATSSNAQAVTIGQIQVTVKNIEKQIETTARNQEKTLDQILQQLRQRPNN